VLTDLRSGTNLKGSTTMRKLVSALGLSISFVGLLGTAALAQPAKGGDKGGGGKVKVYDFSGDTIEGDLVKPEGTDVSVTDFGKHSSLIKIRKDFIPEIIKSAEDL
jgi:hypothetical protein